VARSSVATVQANVEPASAGGTTDGGRQMLLILAIILGLAWITGFGFFHVAGGLIHVLIVLAVISLLLHLVRGRRGS
jgi:Family of unknown function (DUF5670)